MEFFSPAQCVGYGVFLLGVTAFSQKIDRRLKLFHASQCLVYALHFTMLGNLPAGASSLLSSVRSFLAMRTRSRWLAAAIVCLNIAAGLTFAESAAGWLPVLASASATVAMFCMRGVPMRLVLLGCTLAWLANNIITGSIGGALLESTIAIVNTVTVVRMLGAAPGRGRQNSGRASVAIPGENGAFLQSAKKSQDGNPSLTSTR